MVRPAMEYGEIDQQGTLHNDEMERRNSQDGEIRQEGALRHGEIQCLQPDGKTVQEASNDVVNVLCRGPMKQEEIEAPYHEGSLHGHQTTLAWSRNQQQQLLLPYGLAFGSAFY